MAENQTLVVYTVTTGKTLYLVTLTLMVANYSGFTNTGYAQIRDAIDSVKGIALRAKSAHGLNHNAWCNFNPPLALPAGWDISAYSPVAGFQTGVFFAGYEL